MTTTKNVLRIHIRKPNAEDPYVDLEIRPLIDGVDVLEEAFADSDEGARCGDPRDWLVPDGPLSAGIRPHWVDVADPWCGCHPPLLHLKLRREADTVVWTWKAGEEGGPELPEYRFDAAQYDTELQRAGQDSSWEWPAQTVARLLRGTLRAEKASLDQWSCELGNVWTDPDSPDQVLVYFLRDEHSGKNSVRRVEEFGARLTVTDEDPARQAERLARAFLTGDPRAADGIQVAHPPAETLSDWLDGYGHYHGEGPLPWKHFE
ncbi:hypothetical protein ACFWP3_20870 [Streptomyces sp. NPDC058525]|uniref:hypothetical protein n=1 Tax=Streptomyces sp. NPDC058525 TaxID=3346538 RepID=UPI00365317B6